VSNFRRTKFCPNKNNIIKKKIKQSKRKNLRRKRNGFLKNAVKIFL